MIFSHSPTYPEAGESVELSLSSALGSTAVFALTSVPSASGLEIGLILADTNETPDSAVVAASLGVHGTSFTPDVPGAYGLTAYAVRPTAGRFELAETTTATVYVLESADLDIVTIEGHGATLRLGVVDVDEAPV